MVLPVIALGAVSGFLAAGAQGFLGGENPPKVLDWNGFLNEAIGKGARWSQLRAGFVNIPIKDGGGFRSIDQEGYQKLTQSQVDLMLGNDRIGGAIVFGAQKTAQSGGQIATSVIKSPIAVTSIAFGILALMAVMAFKN